MRSDEELVLCFQKTRAPECFTELFQRHSRPVFCSCRAFFGEAERAEDATQETFLRAYKSIDQFVQGDFRNWLLRIARNACIDQWRKTRLETELDGEVTDLTKDLAAQSRFEARLLAERVRQEMKKLSPEQQRCLELKIAGYSYEETAERTGFCVEAVKSYLQNGRRLLWKKLEGEFSEAK